LNEAQRLSWVDTLVIMERAQSGKRKLVTSWVIQPYAALWDDMPDHCTTAEIRAMVPANPSRCLVHRSHKNAFDAIKQALVDPPPNDTVADRAGRSDTTTS